MFPKRSGTTVVGIIVDMGSANERRRYNATSYFIGWTHAQNDPCCALRPNFGTIIFKCLLFYWIVTHLWPNLDTQGRIRRTWVSNCGQNRYAISPDCFGCLFMDFFKYIWFSLGCRGSITMIAQKVCPINNNQVYLGMDKSLHFTECCERNYLTMFQVTAWCTQVTIYVLTIRLRSRLIDSAYWIF